MAAEILEEIVQHRDGLRREGLAPDAVEALLQRRRGGDELTVARHGDLGLHQRLAVDLARGRQRRQGGELLVGGGAHVVGQALVDERAKGSDVDRFAGARHEEGGQKLRAVAIGEEMDDGLRDARPLADHRLDLGQLDAEAADLHLRVDAADELDVADRVEPYEVARAVDALGRARQSVEGGSA